MGSEVWAKLGVDTSNVPKDLEKALAAFKEAGNQIEKQSSSTGANAGEKLAEALGHRLTGSRHLAGALATGLGLNIEKIAENLAGAIVGGSKEGWKRAGEVADEASKLIGKKFELNLTPKQLSDQISKELDRAVKDASDKKPTNQSFLKNALGVIGFGKTDAENLEEANKAQNKILEAEIRKEELAKKEREELKAIAKEQKDIYETKQSKEDRIKQLNKDALAYTIESTDLSKTKVERAQAELDAKKRLLEADMVEKELEKEKQTLKEKQLETQREITKAKDREKELNTDLKIQEQKNADDRAKLSDRSKLSLGELAGLQGTSSQVDFDRRAQQDEEARRKAFSFGSNEGLSGDQIAQKESAQKIEELQNQAELARKAGNSQEAESLLSQVGQMRDQLVNQPGSLLKSTEGDPTKQLVSQIAKDNKETQKILDEIKQIESGKYVNQ